MALSYTTPPDSVPSAKWNTIFNAVDVAQRKLLGNLSLLLQGQALGHPKKFFFFNPVAYTASGLHPLAPAFLNNLVSGSAPNTNFCKNGYLRQYNHSAITGYIAGLAVDTVTTWSNPTSSTFAVSRLVWPTSATWKTTIYPEGIYPSSGADVLVDLDICLAVLTTGANYVALGMGPHFQNSSTINNGYSYYGHVEQVLPWEEIELIINSDLTFPDAWNKYNIFRIHNFGLASHTVSFGSSLTVTVPAGQCRCVRRTAPLGTYTTGMYYFQTMLAGDPLFYGVPPSVVGGAIESGDVFNPMGVLAYLSLVLNRSFDPATFCNIATLYSGWTPSLLPSIASLTVLIGDLLVTKGTFLAVRTAGGTNETVSLNFNGFAGLAALLATVNTPNGITFSLSSGTVTLHTTTSGTVDLIDVGTNLVQMLVGKHRVRLTTGSAALPGFTQHLTRPFRQVQNTATSGGLTNTTLGNDSTDTAGWGGFPSVAYSLMDAVQTLVTFLGTLNCATITVQNVTLRLSPFGPVLTWQDVYTPGPGFSLSWINLTKNFSWAKMHTPSSGPSVIVVQRYFLLAGNLNNSYAPLAVPALNPAWHFPRSDRRYFFPALYTGHVASNEPWIDADFSLYRAKPLLTNPLYVAGSAPPALSTAGATNTPFVYNPAWELVDSRINRFYTNHPISADAITTELISAAKVGFCYMGDAADTNFAPALTGALVETSGILLAQWWAAGGTNYSAYGQTMGDTLLGNQQWYGSEASPTGIGYAKKLTVLESEQINLLVSEFNGLPSPPATISAGMTGNFNFTLDCTSIFIVHGGKGYVVGQHLTVCYGPGIYPLWGYMFMVNVCDVTITSVDAFGAITGITMTHVYGGSSPNAVFQANANPIRPFLSYGSTTGTEQALFDFATGSGAGLNFIPAYGAGGYFWGGGVAGGGGIPVPGNLPPYAYASALASTSAYGIAALWPRNQFFAWFASVGAADPIGDYFTSLGATVQTTLPDGYATNATLMGIDGTFSDRAKAYRWITITDARAIFALFSVPMVINQVLMTLNFDGTTANDFVFAKEDVIYLPGPSSYVAPYNGWPIAASLTPNTSQLLEVLVMLENTSPVCVINVPVNYTWWTGTQHWDNTVEAHPAEMVYLDGTGGPGLSSRDYGYAHPIFSLLANAAVVVVPVDGMV